LQMGNFRELTGLSNLEAAKSEIADLKVKTTAAGVRRFRAFYRGDHARTVEVARFWGLRKRSVLTEVLSDVVVVIELESDPDAVKELGKIRRGARPGAVLLKHFGDVPRSDLMTLHPGAAPAMKRTDQLLLGVPAVAGGFPIIMQLIPALTVIFAVLAAYLGIEKDGELTDDALKRALASLSLFVGLGTFLMRQRLKFDRQRLFYQKKLAETVYYHTVANNEGVIAGLVAEAEEQDWKEAILAYAMLLKEGPATKLALDACIEALLRQEFKIEIDFEMGDALAKLERLGLVTAEGDVLSALPLESALEQLRTNWIGLFNMVSPAQARSA
jgi:hypothetical protein